MVLTYREGKKEREIEELKQQATTIEENIERTVKEQTDKLKKKITDLR